MRNKEIICRGSKCAFYYDGGCVDSKEYVNRQGERVCRYQDGAMLYSDYI